MPIRHSWLSEDHRVLILHFEGVWTWQEFARFYTQDIVPMFAAESHTVHIISDMTKQKSPPLGSALSEARSIVRHLAPNQGMIISLTTDRFVYSLANVFHQIYSRTTAVPTPAAKSMGEALALIKQYDEAHSTFALG